MGPRSSYLSYKITWMIGYRNNTKIYVRIEITPFVGINILSTQMTWILLAQMQEIRSGFCLEVTLVSGFGNLEMWSYFICGYSLLTIGKY